MRAHGTQGTHQVADLVAPLAAGVHHQVAGGHLARNVGRALKLGGEFALHQPRQQHRSRSTDQTRSAEQPGRVARALTGSRHHVAGQGVNTRDGDDHVFGQRRKGGVGALHRGDAGVRVHRGQIDRGIGLAGVLVNVLAKLRHRVEEHGVVVFCVHHGGDSALHAGKLQRQLGPVGLDLGLVHGGDQRHGSVNTGMHLRQLVLNAGERLVILHLRLGGCLVGLHLLAQQESVDLADAEDDNRRQQRRSEQFEGQLHGCSWMPNQRRL